MKKLTITGFVLTALWLVIFSIIVSQDWASAKHMSLNEWGDFLAGLTAPLALLWLVIGYFRQGYELKLNTEALHAQQEELRRQVAETAALAKSHERQAAASELLAMLNQDEVEEEELRRRSNAQPVFLTSGGGVSGGKITTNIENRGGDAFDVLCGHDGPHEVSISRSHLWEHGQVATLTINQKQGEKLTWPIKIRDNLQRLFWRSTYASV